MQIGIGMTRRQFLVGAAGAATVVLVPTSAVEAASPRLRVRARTTARWAGLDQSQNVGGPFTPGVADGPVSFVRSDQSWQRDQILMFQMHGNGNTYRHNGADLDTLSPGVWCYGPGNSQDDSGYAGIASVVRQPESSALLGFVHQEDHTGSSPIGSIGLARNADGLGYQWDHLGTIIRGAELQSEGFRGAALPSVVLDGDTFVMLYGNRFGNGRHGEIRRATAPVRDDGMPGAWTLHGAAFPIQGDPHFYAASPSLRWSTELETWLCLFATDRAFRYCTSDDLISWSEPRSVVWYEQQYLATSGLRRWYPTLIDPSQDHSGIIGRSGVVVEHQIDIANTSDRGPATSRFVIR